MIAEPECYKRGCRHFIGVTHPDGGEGEAGEYVYCKAFPKGIPDDIAFGSNLHNEPIDGDNGIQFKKSSEEEEQ